MTNNKTVLKWLEEMQELLKPEKVVWIDGSDEQREVLREEAVKTGELFKLNEEKLPGCYLHRTNPNDVARVEDRTFICTSTKEMAGPTNNWCDPKEMYEKLYAIAKDSYKGRTMYVIPFSMGPLGGPISQLGVEITDSAYVVGSMKIMTRMGDAALKLIEEKGDFIPCIHSVGKPFEAVSNAPFFKRFSGTTAQPFSAYTFSSFAGA